jgi:hypothetical protein
MTTVSFFPMNSITWPDRTILGRSGGFSGGKCDSLCIGGRPGEAGPDDGHPGNDQSGLALLSTETTDEGTRKGIVEAISMRFF